MLGHIDGGTAVLSAKRKALQQSQRDQDDWRRDADGAVGRQHAHQEGGQAHDHDGDEEGVFAADQIARAPEEEGAERPHEKARRKGQQGKDELAGLGQAREKWEPMTAASEP